MTSAAFATFAAFAASAAPPSSADYRPGICNIGPAEIARRRRAGLVGTILAVAWFAILVAIDAPTLIRLTVALPAAAAASGYLQAVLRFCAGFGSRGLFNFGQLGEEREIDDPDARTRDRRRAGEIALASLAIGIAAGVIAALLPM